MQLESIQHVALLIAASMSVFFLAMRLSPATAGRKPVATWSRILQEGGVGVLTGGFVSLASLAAAQLLLKFEMFHSVLPQEPLDTFTLVCVVACMLM
jgi:hypothetical protein